MLHPIFYPLEDGVGKFLLLFPERFPSAGVDDFELSGPQQKPTSG